ncbi:unnamed protein product [Ascophyllum nodosum]
MGDNKLSGAIPSELGELSALKTLLLHRNQLSGAIPSELGGLSALKELDLYGNQLSGAIPSELGGLSALKTLVLHRNQLSGAIPLELGGLDALDVLDLSRNQLSDLGDVQHALELVSKFDSDECTFSPSDNALDLKGNPWKMPPEAVVEQGLDAIKIFLGDVQKANENGAQVRSLKLLKVVLVGAASAGKTSLMESIIKGTKSPTEGTLEEASTVGIDLRHHLLQGTKIEFYDCAGQVDYAGMHQTFLTQRALYLLVWDVNLFHGLDERNLQEFVHRNIMRWLYTLHLRAPGATVIMVANKCDRSLAAFAETTGRIEKLVNRLLNEWQSRRSSNHRKGGDVTEVRLLDGVSRTSCVDYGGIDKLVERISEESATSIQVPPAWDLALKVLDALRAGGDPLRAARAHLRLKETQNTNENVINTFAAKNQLLKLWEDIVRQVSEELHSAEDMTAVSNWENALNGALWISEFAGQILRIDSDEGIFLDVVWLSKVLSPILSHKLHAEDFLTTALKRQRDSLVRRGVLRWDFVQHIWRDVLAPAKQGSKGRVVESLFRVLLKLGVILPLGRQAVLSDRRGSHTSHGDMLVIMRLPEECSDEQRRAIDSSVVNVRQDCQEVKLKWEFDAAQAPYGLVERLISSCHVIGEVEQDLCWRYGALFTSHQRTWGDNRSVRLYKFVISYDNCMLSLRMIGPLSNDRVLDALRYVASAMVVLSMEWPGVRWEGWLDCPNHPKARIYLTPPGQARIGGQLLDQDARDAHSMMCDCPREDGGVLQLVHQRLGTVFDTRGVSGREDPEFDIGSQRKPKRILGKRKMTYHMSEDEDDEVSDDEVDEVSEDKDDEAFDYEGSSDFGNEKEVILAEGLGTQAMEFLDSSFGIELVLEDKSLEKEIKKQVVVKPGMKFVTCDRERDTSRTHDDLLEWSFKYNDGERRDTSTFLIMPIVHGPSEVAFHPDRPAKLRYFVGNLRNLQDEIREEGGVSQATASNTSIRSFLTKGNLSHDAVAKHLREVYEPFISADGEKWRKLPPFGCVFKTSCNEATDVWLETRLYHLSENAMGRLVSLSKQKKLSGPVHVDEIPRWKGYRDHVVFGNDTKEILIYYTCKLHDTTATDRRFGGGMSVGLFGATADEQAGRSLQSSGLGKILRCVVPAGEFRAIPMPNEGGMVHDQVLYAAFWCEEKLPERPLTEQGAGSSTIKRRQFFLQKDRVNKNRMVIIRQPQVAWWNEQGGTGTTKILDYDASQPEVRKFLLSH